jgi:hypothetical protein
MPECHQQHCNLLTNKTMLQNCPHSFSYFRSAHFGYFSTPNIMHAKDKILQNNAIHKTSTKSITPSCQKPDTTDIT